ncbi:MAG TPA: DNA polymerase III subunit gamma/tau [Gammaproteobacteria bacterium]|nr:DNA polymerase III subunit gamma/tau [Gammaproteobacteria bacterium]
MSYKVLARKWRPGSFSDVIGQQHILQSLSHALDTDRLHHALLFTGTRGVGKTTIARILAKALNCEQGISSTPCGKCDSCIAIDEGRYIDLIEVDAASKTKVDDTRELLDNVQYLPTTGRYKVYLIDEVHMLSRSSFNALLKTLEEPPEHVKFLLATTDPQQLPVTVLSRCLQFNLKRLSILEIKSQLVRILETEKIESDDAALDLLATSADGSMRDGLSLLDQAIAFGAGKVFGEDVRSMLGSIEQRYIHALIESLANDDADALFHAIDDAADRSPDFMMVLNEMLGILYHLSLVQLAPAIIEQRSLDREWLEKTSNKFSAEQLQLFYQICLTGKRDLPLAPDSRTGFEMLMLRMLAFQLGPTAPAVTTTHVADGTQSGHKPPASHQHGRQYSKQHKGQKPVARQSPTQDNTVYSQSESGAKSQTTAVPLQSLKSEIPAGIPADNPIQVEQIKESSLLPEKQPIAEAERPVAGKDWARLAGSLSVTGLTKQLALHMAPEIWDKKQLELVIDAEQEAIYSLAREKELIHALQKKLGGNIQVSIRIDTPVTETPAQQKQRQTRERQQAAEQSIMSDKSVTKMVEAFGASISPASIRPVP